MISHDLIQNMVTPYLKLLPYGDIFANENVQYNYQAYNKTENFVTMLSVKHQIPIFESLVWLDLGLNPGLPGHMQTL